MSRLFVASVPPEADTNELKDLFSDCGKIKFFGISEGSGYMV